MNGQYKTRGRRPGSARPSSIFPASSRMANSTTATRIGGVTFGTNAWRKLLRVAVLKCGAGNGMASTDWCGTRLVVDVPSADDAGEARPARRSSRRWGRSGLNLALTGSRGMGRVRHRPWLERSISGDGIRKCLI